MEARSELTPKQLAFVRAYKTNGCNATKAAICAGYSKKAAKTLGQRLTTKPKIKAELGLFEKEMKEKYEYDLDAFVRDIDDGLCMAKKQNNASSYLKGVELKGKAFGLLSEKVENKTTITGIEQALVIWK